MTYYKYDTPSKRVLVCVRDQTGVEGPQYQENGWCMPELPRRLRALVGPRKHSRRAMTSAATSPNMPATRQQRPARRPCAAAKTATSCGQCAWAHWPRSAVTRWTARMGWGSRDVQLHAADGRMHTMGARALSTHRVGYAPPRGGDSAVGRLAGSHAVLAGVSVGRRRLPASERLCRRLEDLRTHHQPGGSG